MRSWRTSSPSARRTSADRWRHGAHKVQIDFTEGRLACKFDPSGGLLRDFVALNNQVLDRFSVEERSRIGVHTCPGGDMDSTHSADVDYAQLLPDLFQLNVGNLYVEMAGEQDPRPGPRASSRRTCGPINGSSSA